MASNLNNYTLPQLIAKATVADSNGDLALRTEDVDSSGTVPAAILKQIANSNNAADALKHFFSEDANGNMAFKLSLLVTS